MNRILATLGMILLAGIAFAQERVDPEEAQRRAQFYVEQSAQLEDLPLKIDPDASLPYGLRHEDVSGMVIPHKKLTLDALEKAGKEIIPVGQFWVRKLTLVINDEPVAKDRLRLVPIKQFNQVLAQPLFLVGARKGTAGPELVVFAKDKEPITTIPLKKAETRQEFPIQMIARGENGRGHLTLQLLGSYEAEIILAIQE